MDLTLFYRGPLVANGKPDDKHLIRSYLHPQLKELWEHEPLSRMKELLDPDRKPENPPGGNSLIFESGGHSFACLVSKRLHTTASLDITLLRPEKIGNILTQSGDLDNRLKTLLDALSMPRHENQISKAWQPSAEEIPFYCLLEDDGLVTRVNIDSRRWLNPSARSDSEVVLLIHVRTTTHRKTYENFDF